MYRFVGRNHLVSLTVLTAGILLTTINVFQLQRMQSDMLSATTAKTGATTNAARPKYAVYGKNVDSGYLKHVFAVLERSGFLRVNYNVSDDWHLLWAHDYPFKKLRANILHMKRHQRVNKLPGSGFVTNKVNLATSGISPHIPRAFKVPDDVKKFREYATKHPDKLFVQKNKNHRGIKIEKVEQLNLKDNGSFIQEFVDNPLLIDGYKFDIGVYTYITSIDPLRIYTFNSDVLLRFCPEKYEPFDAGNRDKYVVHDDYRPTWKVPTLAKWYSDLGYSFKETLNAYLRSLGRDPNLELWRPILGVIRAVYKAKEKEFINALKNYPHKRSFFELVRFDFVLDNDLNLYLMEANMSPNLSSKHFPPNRLLYEQVLYTLFRLNGLIGDGSLTSEQGALTSRSEESEMRVADKDLRVFADECSSEKCSEPSACEDAGLGCHLCKRCLASEDLEFLEAAFVEHVNRHNARRIFPDPTTRDEASHWREWKPGKGESMTNFKMRQWFAGKCLADENWCS